MSGNPKHRLRFFDQLTNILEIPALHVEAVGNQECWMLQARCLDALEEQADEVWTHRLRRRGDVAGAAGGDAAEMGDRLLLLSAGPTVFAGATTADAPAWERSPT